LSTDKTSRSADYPGRRAESYFPGDRGSRYLRLPGRQGISDWRADRRLHRALARRRAFQSAGDAVSHAYQTNSDLRDGINAGQTGFFELHLSVMPQVTRYRFLGPVEVVVIEAADITAGGGILLTSAVGAAPTFAIWRKR
jgi:acyl-CoA hydrolase